MRRLSRSALTQTRTPLRIDRDNRVLLQFHIIDCLSLKR